MNVITIDGTCYTGKSTSAGIVATKLGFKHLNTGLAYRGLTLLKRFEGPFDPRRILMTSSGISIDNEHIPIEELKNPEMDQLTSDLSKLEEIQKMACGIIRECAGELLDSGVPGLAIEGRNTGTFLFPDARLKIWLSANQSVRLHRAACDAIGTRPEHQILSELLVRDHQDYSRPFAPLARPEKSMEIDTSDFNPEFVGKTIAAAWNALCA